MSLKKIDKAVLRVEWDSLVNNPKKYDIFVNMDGVPELHWKPTGFWNPVEAERVFLTTYSDLCHDYR